MHNNRSRSARDDRHQDHRQERLAMQPDLLRQWNGDPHCPRVSSGGRRVNSSEGNCSTARSRGDRAGRAGRADSERSDSSRREGPDADGTQRGWPKPATILVYEPGWRRVCESPPGGRTGWADTDLSTRAVTATTNRHQQGRHHRVRWIEGELAWSWLRFQPESALTRMVLRAVRRRHGSHEANGNRGGGQEAGRRPSGVTWSKGRYPREPRSWSGKAR